MQNTMQDSDYLKKLCDLCETYRPHLIEGMGFQKWDLWAG